MSHPSPTPTDIDPAALDGAHRMWGGFTVMIKYGVIGVVALLLAMAIFLI